MKRIVSLWKANQWLTRINSESVATAVCFSAIAAFHAWSLLRYPAPFVDEAWYASRAWAFLHTGRGFGVLDAGVFDRYEGYWTFFQQIPVWLQALSIRLYGQLDILPLRVLSLLFGMGLLAAVFFIGRRIGGQALGLLGVCLSAVSVPFLTSAHMARYDIFVAALGFSAVALYLYHRFSNPWVAGLAGLLIGLAVEIHINGLIYVPVIMVLYFVDLRRSILTKKHLCPFLAGLGVMFIFYAAMHILPYPKTYIQLSELAYAPTHTSPILTLNPSAILQAFLDLSESLIWTHLVVFPLIIWAVVILVKRHGVLANMLLLVAASLTLAYALWVRNKMPYYAILVTPIIDLLLASLLLHVLRKPHNSSRVNFQGILVLSIIVTYAVLNLFPLRQDAAEDYQSVTNYLRQTIQNDSSIMGSQTYWFGFADHVYYSWEELIFYQRYAPGSTAMDAMREFRPDIFIVDGHLDGFISDEIIASQYFEQLRLPRTDLAQFLSQNAQLLSEFDDRSYGEVRVYRINWSKQKGDVP